MFNVENGAADSLKEVGTEEKTLKIGESAVTYKTIEGDDAKAEWLRLCMLISEMVKGKSKQSSRGSKRGGRGGRGKRGFGRGRRDNWKPAGKNRDSGEVEEVSLGKRSREEEQPTAKHIRMANSDED